MTRQTRLLLAPAGGGKTAYLVDEARRLAQGLTSTPRVVVPTRLQARAWRRRLADGGALDGAMGVRVGTFDDLYREILHASGEVIIRLTDPVQFRLLRALLDEANLTHYDALQAAPGFVQVMRDLIRELKAGGIFPDDLAAAVAAMGGEPRLSELVELYAAYQQRLRRERWADYAGIGWLAAETLRREPDAGADWSALMVDGFDDLTTVQIQVLHHLAGRVGTLTVTLTGTADGAARDLVHQRFNRTRQRLEKALGMEAEPLPELPAHAPALRHLERSLFAGDHPRQPAGGAVTLIAAPDREAEVRAALRWLKTRIVQEGMRPGEVALLYRDSEPYRAFITQTAAEFGLPVHGVDGRPLRSNPTVAALFNLLRMARPGDDHLTWRKTVEAWRSPYFDWGNAALDITLQDAEALDWVARWGSVIGGLEQWEETFELLAQAEDRGGARDEEVREMPDVLPVGEEADRLSEQFHCFVERITPPAGRHPARDFVSWLEALIGDADAPEDEETTADLGVARQVLDGPEDLVERDLAALNVLKDVLRGLVWAEEAVDGDPMTFDTFLDDLEGAVEAATYRVPLPADEEGVLVADVVQARGLPFRAVAVLGLAEGEFPQTLTEDPFLRDADRARLRDDFGLALDLSTASAEPEYFYEAVTRAREALLLTRPRIADNGAPWEPSSYWEEVRRRLDVTPQRLTTQSRPAPDEAASWSELAQTLAARLQDGPAWAWASEQRPALFSGLERAERILAQRARDSEDAGAHDGDLTAWMETYRTCPFFFFVGRVLGLEPRQPPTEGLDARQLGNIYHHIFEELYRSVGQDADLAALQDALPEVADAILDAAPRREQFRATAWWEQTRQDIVKHVARSLETLESRPDDFGFYQAEQTFGIPKKAGAPLDVYDGDDHFRLRGYIDRVDRDGDGHVRVIDYKTASPSAFSNSAVREGKKLQLPLYALAAEEALQLGEVVDGFYWHVQHAEPSRFTLADFGPEAAMETAVAHAWEAVRGSRRGDFIPRIPDDDCPDYCPAAAFCWHFDPRNW
jgi:ATP-dependent helicase/DNAse subunit B